MYRFTLHWTRGLVVLGCLFVLGFSSTMATWARASTGGYNCEFDLPDSTYALKAAALPRPNMHSALLRLRISFLTVSGAPPGTTGWTSTQVSEALERLRADFAPLQIHFNVVSIAELPVTSEYYYGDHASDVLDNYLGSEIDTIDAVLAFAPTGETMGSGLSWGADMPDSPPARCIVNIVDAEDYPILSHEIGHCLGLLHTAHNPGSGTACGPTSQCSSCQDLVCDTPFDPYIGPLRDHVDELTCQYDGEYPELTPPVNNIMALTWPSCMTGFTEGQGERMLWTIENTPFLQDCSNGPQSRYECRSDDTNLDYDGTPYSSVILDYNTDTLKDLFISMRDNSGSLQKQTNLAQSEVPQFIDRTDNDFAYGNSPQTGLRGVVAADYNNDEHVDLFVAGESNPRLYHNNNGTFVDRAAVLGLAALADSSYAGAWGDFDRDGQIDLYVCRGAGGGSDPTAANMSAVRGRLFRNDFRGSGTFVDRSDSLGAAANAVGASVAASWADVEGDGDLDLFVGDLRDASGSASSRFYINNGAGSLSESFASRFSGLNIENVNSTVWADMDSDGYLDLVLGSETAPPAVYFNNGSGDFDSLDPLLANLDAATNAVRPVDSDLDGMQDLLAIPRSTSEHRRWFWNQVIGGDRALLDQSWRVGFADSVGRVDGLAMADFNGDGDSDIFFGRPVDSHDVFYRAKSTTGDDPVADWVGVRLVAGGGNNGSAIGASVRFIVSDSTLIFEQVQVVDGGSGKGGQADNVLICGLGSTVGAVSAEIKWPGGFVQTASLTRRQVNTITDETVPGVPSTVSGVYTALPEGQAELTFTWDTAYSCKPSRDKVTITDRPKQPSQCPMGTVVLTPSSDNVSHAVMAKAGGGYRHRLTWPLECRAPCAYNFLIESSTDATHKSEMAQTEQISTPVCISQ